MNEDFKKIAKGLGIVLPACLLTIGAANAANTMPTRNSDVPSVCVKMNKGNDVISHLRANTMNFSSDRLSPDHTDTHSDYGNNHVNQHSDYPHSDNHNDRSAKTTYTTVRNDDGTTSRVPSCTPHTDNHTNKDRINNHTNSGNRYHTNQHTNRNTSYDCN